MDYSLLTEQQLQKRYYTLPNNVMEVLESEKEIESVRQICRNHHIVDEEKILIVEQLVGLILLGFVQTDDLSREISENIHLNRQHSGDIASEIDRKIFGPIRADLEKVYSPPTTEEREERKDESDAEIIDLRKTEAEKPTETEKPTEAEKPEIIPIVPPKVEKIPEEIKPQKIEIPPTLPTIPILEEDKPKIIHEEKKIAPLTDTRKRTLAGLFGFLRKEEKGEQEKREKRKEESVSPTPVRVQLETKESFGKMALPQKSEIAKTEIPKPRVVHYNDLRTPLPFGAIQEERDKRKEESNIIKPPENLPITEPPKIEPVVENEEDVIDLRTFEKFKKPQ